MSTGAKKGYGWLRWVLGVAILGGLILAAAKYIRGEEVLAALGRFNWAYAVPILIMSAAYLLLKAWWFTLALRSLCDVPAGVLMRAYMAGQPATLLPGGVAARAGLLAEVGVPASTSSAPVILNSVFDQVAFLLLALAGAAWYPAARGPALLMGAVVAGIGIALAVPLTRNLLTRALGAVMRKFKLGPQWEHFTLALGRLSSWRILGNGLVLTLLAKLLLVVILGLCLAAIGLHAGAPALLLATTLPTVLGRLTPLPGGVGPTEAGMVGLLGSTAQIDPSAATAAVGLFRLATIVFQALLGAAVYFFFWHAEREPQASQTAPPGALHSS
jgi:uncharacterized protein (TIRG00374 family)